MTNRLIKKGTLIGSLMQIPIWILAAIGAFQLGAFFFFSFTEYDVLNMPKFIGFDNYRILADDMVITTIKNTVVCYSFSAILVFVFGVLPAVFIARLKKWVGIIFSAAYAFLTLASYTGSFHIFFSGDAYGFLNSQLLSLRIITEPISWINEYSGVLSVLILTISVVGPVFIIAYIGASCKKSILGGAAAMISAVLLMIGAEDRIVALFGYPSIDYKATFLPSVIDDYLLVRFEVGKASALSLVGVVLLVQAIALIVGIAVIVRLLSRKNIGSKKSKAPAILFVIISAVFVLTTLCPIMINLSNIFKPIEELLVLPQKFFVRRPTVSNFSFYFSLLDYAPLSPSNFVTEVFKFFFVYILAVLPSSVGFALVEKNKTKLLFLIPIALSLCFYEGRFYVGYNRMLASILTVVVFITGFYIAFLWKCRGKLVLALGIPALISLCLASAVTFVNYTNNSGWLTFNMHFYSGGIVRAGSVAVGDFLLMLFTIALFCAPLVLLLILFRKNSKKPSA